MSGTPDGRDKGWTARVASWLIAGALVMAVAQAYGQAEPSKEYQVKAALLLNFAQFIQWPEGRFATPDAPIVVGVLGEDPFGVVLDQTFQDELIDGRKLVIKRSRQIADLKNCHIVFISKSEKDRLGEAITAFHDGSVVTVGEIDQFVQRGGILNFYVDKGKIRFEINPDAAGQKELKINSQLLKRAKIVHADSAKGRE